jgi:hypothetical protein
MFEGAIVDMPHSGVGVKRQRLCMSRKDFEVRGETGLNHLLTAPG